MLLRSRSIRLRHSRQMAPMFRRQNQSDLVGARPVRGIEAIKQIIPLPPKGGLALRRALRDVFTAEVEPIIASSSSSTRQTGAAASRRAIRGAGQAERAFAASLARNGLFCSCLQWICCSTIVS